MSKKLLTQSRKTSAGVTELFEAATSEAPKQVNLISKGTLPFPAPIAPSAPTDPKVFPTKRNTGETMPLEEAIVIASSACTQRLREISMIGFKSQNDWENSADENDVAVEYQVLKEKAMKTVENGSSRKGFIVGPDGLPMDSAKKLIAMIDNMKSVGLVKRMANQRRLYLFELGEGYIGYTDTVRVEDVLNQNQQALVRLSYTQTMDDFGKFTGPRRQLLYTPINLGCPLHETKIVSFVIHDRTGFELWQPGQYIGALNPKEKECWVHIDLLEH